MTARTHTTSSKRAIMGNSRAVTYKKAGVFFGTKYFDITDYCGKAYIKDVDSGVVTILVWGSPELADFMSGLKKC